MWDYDSSTNSYFCTGIKFDDNSKKYCQLVDSTNCIEKYLTCEGYTGKNEAKLLNQRMIRVKH